MGAIAVADQVSTGHDCYPPTQAIGPFTTKTFIKGKPIQLATLTKYADHECGDHVHTNRTVVSGSSTTFIQGYPVARIGDPISCGDTVGQGTENTFCGG